MQAVLMKCPDSLQAIIWNENDKSLMCKFTNGKRKVFSTYSLCSPLSLPMLGDKIPSSCMYGRFLKNKSQSVILS